VSIEVQLKIWQRRLLAILAIGGGFIGAVQCIATMVGTRRVVEWVFVLAGFAFYCWGVWCGTRLMESQPGAERANRVFWLAQVPTFSTPVAGYFLTCGFHVTVKLVFAPFKFAGNFLLGSTFEYSLLQSDEPIYVGMNIFAFGIAGWLIHTSRHETAGAVSSQA
jgi:hypothetical protein